MSFCIQPAVTHNIVNAVGKLSHDTSTRSCLCISSMLLNNFNSNMHNLESVFKSTHKSCNKNYLQRLTPSLFEQLFTYTDKIRTVVRLLRWIVENASRIKFKGIRNLILDTLHDSQMHEIPEIINLLKQVRSLGIGIIIFDEKNNLIKVEEMDGVLSFDNYLNIIILSLVYENYTKI